MELPEENETWEQMKDRLKERYSSLGEDDFLYEPGKSDEMFENLREKLDVSKAELAAVISGI